MGGARPLSTTPYSSMSFSPRGAARQIVFVLLLVALPLSSWAEASPDTREQKRPIYLRDPSEAAVTAGCEFEVPIKPSPMPVGSPMPVYSGNGHFWEYYHFLIDFVPRLLEVLQAAKERCPVGSTARLWMNAGGDRYEHYHFTQGFFCPMCSRETFESQRISMQTWTLEEAMKVNLNGRHASMQPQFDFLFQQWGPPVIADKGFGYGKNLTFPEEKATLLPYPKKSNSTKWNEKYGEEWSAQPAGRFEKLRLLGWKLAGVQPPAPQGLKERLKQNYVVLIRRRDPVGANRRSLDADFDEKASAFFAKHSVRLLIVSLTDYSMAEQIRIFAHAAMIIGVHGAGLANMVWAQRGTVIFELGPYSVPCYEILAQRMGMPHALALRRSVRKYSRLSSSGIPNDNLHFSNSFDNDLEELLVKHIGAIDTRPRDGAVPGGATSGAKSGGKDHHHEVQKQGTQKGQVSDYQRKKLAKKKRLAHSQFRLPNEPKPASPPRKVKSKGGGVGGQGGNRGAGGRSTENLGP